MQIDLSAPILDFRNKPIKMAEGDQKGLTLSAVCIQALMLAYPDEQNLSGEEKLRRYQLAEKIDRTDGLMDIESRDIVTLKEMVGKLYSASVVGPAFMLLEGKDPYAGRDEGAASKPKLSTVA